MADQTGITTVMIGGIGYGIAPLNFKRVKRIWPLVSQANDMSDDPERAMEAIEACLKIIEIALEPAHPEMTLDRIEDDLLASELMGLKTAMIDTMVASGLMERKTLAPGEGKGPAAGPLTEIGTALSPNSFPLAAPQGTGTA